MARTMIVEQLNLFSDKFETFFNENPYKEGFNSVGRTMVDRWLKLFKEHKFEDIANESIVVYGHSNAYYLDAFKAKIGVTCLASNLTNDANYKLFILQLEAAYQRIVS